MSRPRDRFTLVGIELFFAVGFLGLATLAGLVFVHRPWPNRLDSWGFSRFPAAPLDHTDLRLARLGSLRVLVIGVLVCALVAALRDRTRLWSAIVGPVLAVFVTERLAKPLVARHLYGFGANSYPSGTVTAVAALSMVIVLISPRWLRLVTVPGAIVVIGAVCVAVVTLRWHFPTDALGGIGVGIGGVLAIDALVQIPGALRAWRRAARHPGSPAHSPRRPQGLSSDELVGGRL